MPSPDVITLELELDATRLEQGRTPLDAGTWISVGEAEGIEISRTLAESGHGFGFTEVVTIAISIGSSVASDLVADAIRKAAGGVIRKARGRRRRSDGSKAGLVELIEDERCDPTGMEASGDR